MKRTLIFDTETTNLIANSLVKLEHQPYVTEFYGEIIDETGQVTDELSFRCKPPVPSDPKAVAITGINDAMLADCDPFSSRIRDVRDFFALADSAVAHSFSFDYFVLESEFKRYGTGLAIPWPIVRICTVEQTEWIKGHRLSLENLHRYLFNVGFEGAHGARADVKALTRCFNELRKRDML